MDPANLMVRIVAVPTWSRDSTVRICSLSRSVSFRASRIRLSEILNQILPSSSKISKKPLYFFCFVTSSWLFLSLKNDVNVPSKSKKQKTLERKKYFSWRHWRKDWDPDPWHFGTLVQILYLFCFGLRAFFMINTGWCLYRQNVF